jgi:hypothetical protein
LRDNLKLSFRQKLQWLEDMTAFAKRLQAAPTHSLQEVQAVYAAKKADTAKLSVPSAGT